MTDPIRRAVRTWLQAFLGSFITSGVLSAASTDGIVDWSAVQKALIAAAAASVVALLTFVQNLLEDTTSMPALLKAPASEGENPVPAPGPARDARGRFVGQRGISDVAVLTVCLFLAVLVIILLATNRI